MQIDLLGFWNTIVSLGEKLLQPGEITYGFRDSRKLFPQIWIHYIETMIVFLSAFLLSLFIAYVLVVWVLQRSHRKQRIWNGVFLTLESIPDILLILLSQLLVVIMFQKTGFMPVKLAGLGEERIRLLPIICLTIPTTLLFIKLLLLRFKEELEKDYSLFAKGKGLSLRQLTTHTWIVLIPIAFYSMTILSGNLISNSMQDAIKLGNVRIPKSKDTEMKEEKKVPSTVNDFSFYREIQK